MKELLDGARPSDHNIGAARASGTRKTASWPSRAAAITGAVNDRAVLASLIVQDFLRALIDMAASNAISGRKRADNNAARRAAPTVASRAGAGAEAIHRVGRRGTRKSGA